VSPHARNLLAGLAAGAVLSLARAPLGLDVTGVPATPALTSMLFRALALLAVGVGLGARLRVASWLAGVTLGFGLHGFLLASRLELGGWLGLTIALVLGVLAIGFAASRPDPEDAPAPATALERAGLFVAGAGIAVTLESIARTLRLLGSGQPFDDTAFGFVLLVALTLGAAAFGGWLTAERRAAAGLGAGVALAAVAGLYSVQLLGDFSAREGLDRFLRSPPWALDLSQRGRLYGDLLIGGRVVLVPAFVLGMALCGARHRSQLASLLAGGGAGLVLLAMVLIDGAPSTEIELSLATAERVTLGAWIAAAGGLLATFGARARLTRGALVIGMTGCLAAVAGGILGPKTRALPISPWEQFPASPEWIADTPEGLMTIEPRPGGARLLTLARRPLTPDFEESEADVQRIALAHGLLTAEQQESARVLLVGQLTPERAFTLRQLRAARVDRTAAWHAVMPAIEAHLFGDDALPAGDVIAPAVALERMNSRAYDLVLVPPVRGTSPHAPAGGDETRVVVWLDATGSIAHRDWGTNVLLSSHGVDYLAVGVHGGTEGAPTARAAAPPTPLLRVLAWPFDRDAENVRAVSSRLEWAGVGTPAEALGHGLALHAAAQSRSSPWETGAQQTEVSAEALIHLRDAALSMSTDAALRVFLTDLWEGLAAVLVQKREIDLIYEHIEPLAEALAPWPALERALAYADLEMLEPERAAERLKAVIARSPFDLNARLARAQALNQAGNPKAAAEELRAVLEVQPDRQDVLRRLAVTLVRAGDPEGVPMIEDLLLEDPDDEDLRMYLGPGPFPALPIEFTPNPRHDH
jgi:hypothetical protein